MSVQWFDRETLDRIIKDHIQKVDVVLDIGCGIRPQTFFQSRVHICCEPHPEYVKILQNRFDGVPNIVILQGTAQKVVELMPDKSVDSVFLIDLIEHLEKDDGHRLLLQCERIARRQIICFTPMGFMRQEYGPGDVDGWGLHGGEWQVHKSGWTPDDFDTSWDILASKAYHTISGSGKVFDPPLGAFWAIKNIREKEYIASPVKLAVLSHILPPSPSGQAMTLYRLLRDLRPEDYCLLSRQSYDTYTYEQNSPSRLPARYYHLAPGCQLRRPNGFGMQAVCKLFNAFLQILQCVRSIVCVVKREKCDVILACSGDIIDLPAGYLASRWVRSPFYAYIFDDYSYQWPQRLYRFFARCVEPIVLKGAAGVIVPNEFLRDEYRRRYQVESIVVHNPCEVLEIDEEYGVPWPASTGEIKIVYTGGVYHTHYDAFRNLIAAIQQLGQPDLKLHLYTAQSLTELERENICGPIVYHSYLSPSHVFEVQRRADILFLPLAFNSTIPEVIKTSAPGKMGEYLASGRPILVHAPVDSFVSWYCKEHKCSVVVDQHEPGMLAQAIRRILDDADLRRRIGENARARARADFNLTTARTEFLKLFQTKVRG